MALPWQPIATRNDAMGFLRSVAGPGRQRDPVTSEASKKSTDARRTAEWVRLLPAG